MIRSIIILIAFVGLGCEMVSAQSADFTIAADIISADLTPPTAPTNLTATAASDSQIDLAWDASFDVVGVSGYQVWRDMLQVATVTTLTYVDTGLASSTLYTYYVRAFDAANNFSASSTAAATTTLAPPPPVVVATTTSSADGRLLPQQLSVSAVRIDRTTDTATLTFTTDQYAATQVAWGTTRDALDQSLVITALYKNHTITLQDLEPGLTYYGRITVTDRTGTQTVERPFTFTTIATADTIPPANVTAVRVISEDQAIVLSWQNPATTDFAGVRIVRSDTWFPIDVADGIVVYEGDAATFTDTTVRPGVVYYYTIFAYDTSRNYASGAVTLGTLTDTTGTAHTPDAPATTTTSALDEPLMPAEFTQAVPAAGDLAGVPIFISQGDQRTELPADGVATIMQNVETTIAIPYEALPLHLKSVLVTLQHPETVEQTFSFLLRLNDTREYYQATFGSLPVSGFYPMEVTLYDFTKQLVSVRSGELIVVAPPLAPAVNDYRVVWWMLLLILVLVGLQLWRRLSA